MDNLYNSLAQAFGPLAQVIFACFITFLTAWCICAAAYWSERKLIQAKKPVLWIFPILIPVVGLLYGGLRFSGLLLYSADSWAQWGPWNQTRQNSGAYILFICGCLLAGAAWAVRKERRITELSS